MTEEEIKAKAKKLALNDPKLNWIRTTAEGKSALPERYNYWLKKLRKENRKNEQ